MFINGRNPRSAISKGGRRRGLIRSQTKKKTVDHKHHVLKDLNRTYRDQIPSIRSEIFVGSKAVQKGCARVRSIHRWDTGKWSRGPRECDQVGARRVYPEQRPLKLEYELTHIVACWLRAGRIEECPTFLPDSGQTSETTYAITAEFEI